MESQKYPNFVSNALIQSCLYIYENFEFTFQSSTDTN